MDEQPITAWELIRELTRAAPESEVLIEVDGEFADALSVVLDTRNGKPVIRLVDYP